MSKDVCQHIIAHWNKDIKYHFKQTTNLVYKILSTMGSATETKFGITFGQLYSIIVLAMGVFAAWLQINIRITKIETDNVNRQELLLEVKQQYKELNLKLDNTNTALNQLIGETKIEHTKESTNGNVK